MGATDKLKEGGNGGEKQKEVPREIIENITLEDSYEFFSAEGGQQKIAYSFENNKLYVSNDGKIFYEMNKFLGSGDRTNHTFSYYHRINNMEVSLHKEGDSIIWIGEGGKQLAKFKKENRLDKKINAITRQVEFSATLKDGRKIQVTANNNHTTQSFRLFIDNQEIKIREANMVLDGGSLEIRTITDSLLYIPRGFAVMEGRKPRKPIWVERKSRDDEGVIYELNSEPGAEKLRPMQ